MKKLIVSLLLSTSIAYGCPTLKDDVEVTLKETRLSVTVVEMMESKMITLEQGVTLLENIRDNKKELISHILVKHQGEHMADKTTSILIKETLEIDKLLNDMKGMR